jgi:hypothetical protein
MGKDRKEFVKSPTVHTEVVAHSIIKENIFGGDRSHPLCSRLTAMAVLFQPANYI